MYVPALTEAVSLTELCIAQQPEKQSVQVWVLDFLHAVMEYATDKQDYTDGDLIVWVGSSPWQCRIVVFSLFQTIDLC